jgi:hypothetical protein
MLEAKREAVALEPQDVVELEEIIIDRDEKAAYEFLKERVYKTILSSQSSRLKPEGGHL